MRIASSQFQASMNRSLQINQTVIAKLTEQMATGNKIQVPSDEPIANVRLSRLRREENIVSQYVDNISAVKIRLSKNETYLSSMVGDMGAARDLFVWASDGSNTPADLNSMVNSLVALRDSLFFNGNTKDQEGKYIFSGTLTSTAALAYDATQPLGSRYTYTGNNDGPEDYMYGFPASDPAQPALKVATEQYVDATTPDTIDRSVSAEESASMYRERVAGRFPQIDGRAVKARACMYTVTPDRRFVIDALDGMPNLLVVSACSGHGFKHSAGLGDAIADHVLGLATTLDLSPFARGRLLEKTAA